VQLVGKGAPAAVEVVTEKRQGSKKVTRVLGLEALLLSPAAVAGDLQRTFAGSASVQVRVVSVCAVCAPARLPQCSLLLATHCSSSFYLHPPTHGSSCFGMPQCVLECSRRAVG
jgi:hypothetical protein